MKEEIKKLLALQEIDKIIYEGKITMTELPQQVQGLRDAEVKASEELEAVKKKAKETEAARKNKEVEIDTAKEKILKFDTQLYQIKDNKEYRSMLKQIEDAKKIVSKLEDEILECMEIVEEAKKEVEIKEQILQEEKAKLEEKEDECNREVAKVKGKLTALETERKSIAEGIKDTILGQYERILDKRKDSAIAPVMNDCCSACNMVLLVQVLDDAKGCRKLVICDTCSRILYDPETL